MSRTGLATALEVLVVACIVAWTALVGVDRSVTAALDHAQAHGLLAPEADPEPAAAPEPAPEAADLESAAIDEDGPPRSPQEVRGRARTSAWVWSAGILALLIGRLVALRGRHRHIAVPFLIPGVALMTGMGLALHWAYSDPVRITTLGGPAFAQGVLLGGLLAAALMTLPIAPERMIARAPWLVVTLVFSSLGALYLFGESPGLSGARVRLFGAQPIEAVKLAIVALVATSFGHRAEQLRYQRTRHGSLQLPRLKLLAPAAFLVLALFLGLYLVRDFGPTLILALVLLALYYAVTRSWVELVTLAALGGVAFAVVVSPAAGFLPANVATRIAMMRDPWLNGQAGGDQLAASLWAFASGGLTGRGLGQAELGALPAGHTDLILAHLAEVGGLFGLGLYLLALFLIVWQGYWIGMRNRTPERMVLACGLAALIFAQLLVIFGGSTGWLPLTGIVVPFLSFGRTSMVIFLAVVALLVRLAADGQPVREHDALRQVRGGIARVATATFVLAVLALAVAADRTVLRRSKSMTRGVLAIGFDDAVFLRYDPRMRAIARRIKRGEIHDREGVTLAGTGPTGARTYPLGSAMGTLLGVLDPSIGTPPWALEGALDARLRGLREIDDPRSVWVLRRPDENLADGSRLIRRDRILFSVPTHELRSEDLLRARQLQPAGTTLLFSRMRRVDHSPLVPIARRSGAAREAAIRAVSDDLSPRTIRLSIDARLQAAAARAVATVAEATGPAGAAAVIDVDSGQVLARAQWPDVDPARASAWLRSVRATDPVFTGSYGPWKDKTGVAGLYQAGSIFKLFTALAWARQGSGNGSVSTDVARAADATDACGLRATATFSCTELDSSGPFFNRPDWLEPIHDSHSQPDGIIEITRALAVSCNVFFGQLGLTLGPEPLIELAAAGLEVDNGRGFTGNGTGSPATTGTQRPFAPGTPGSRRLASTAFGQGAARLHVVEAARLVAAIGAGGIYRRCPPSLLLEAPCDERVLIDDPNRVAPLLAGMRRVVTEGTARRLRAPANVRLYAKTGTATDPGRIDEVPYGFEQGKEHRDHSWMVALAEPASNAACDAQATGRLAFAAVVPRGGQGAGPALTIVQRLIDQAVTLGLLGPRNEQ